jgi:ABC-2 type transport system permease protein
MFKILKKELKAFLKDKRAVMLTFLMPTILITVFALAFGGSGGDEVRTIPLLVCDQDKTEITKSTINAIDSVKMIQVIPCGYDSAVDLIKKGKKTSVIIFPKGFTDSVKAEKQLPWEFQYDEARVQETGIMQSLLKTAVYTSIGKLWRNRSISSNPFIDSTMQSTMAAKYESESNKLQKLIKLKTTSIIEAQVGNVGLVQAVAGTAVMMLLFSLSGMGGGLLDEKEQGTLKRLLYSPVNPAEILLGKMSASIIVAMFQLSVMFIYASLIFHLHILDKIVPLAILIFATAVACTGFGIFLATLARSRSQLQSMSTLIILSMSVIGGSMVPIFLMPQWMQNVSVVSINYWSIQGFYDILWRGLPIGVVFLTKVGILLAIGITLTLLAFRFFKKNVLALD